MRRIKLKKISLQKIKKGIKRIFLWISIGVGIVFFLFGLFFYFLVPSFDELAQMTTERALRNPVRFYANLHVFHPGDPLFLDDILTLLKHHKYKKVSEYPTKAKEFYPLNKRHLQVFVDLFTYPDGVVTGGIHDLYFNEKGRLERIKRLQGKVEVNEMRLEPLPLDDFARGSVETSQWVPLEKMSGHLIQSLILSEDKRFYRHFGVDLKGITRAFLTNIKKSGKSQGGSTLTQQLIKNVYLTPEKTYKRKLIEICMALMLEWRYSKETILEMYLNQIYMGQNGVKSLYGVGEASHAFFGKPAGALSPSESATLVGMIPAPNSYHPRRHSQKSLKRRNLVLKLLWQEGKLSQEEFQKALLDPLKTSLVPAQSFGFYYISWIRQVLEEKYSRFLLDNTGMQVYLSLDIAMQQSAEKALSSQELEGAMVVMNPQTGFVKALVGGKNYRESPYNRALLAKRQPGSSFKPILYASALESETVHLASFLEDKPIKMDLHGKVWEPKNYSETFQGTTTVRNALVKSLNVPSIHLLEKVGTDLVVDLAHRLGIKSELDPVPSLALGTSEVSPLELTTAYAAFANGGYSVKPVFVRWVVDEHGNILEHNGAERRMVLSRETSYLMTDLLKDVVVRGTGRNVRRYGYKGIAAGKTGTSDDYSDAWFVGFNPKVVCGVWLGHDIPTSLGKSSARLAVPVWVKFMKSIESSSSYLDFSIPENIIEVKIDPETGLRSRAGCPQKGRELFIKGNVPKPCKIHSGSVSTFFKKMFGIFGRKESK